MIGAAGKEDDGAALLQCLGVDLSVDLHQAVFIVVLCLDSLGKGTADERVVHPEAQQVAATLAVERLLVLEGEHRRIDGHIGGLHALEYLRITGHDRTVVAVLLAS